MLGRAKTASLAVQPVGRPSVTNEPQTSALFTPATFAAEYGDLEPRGAAATANVRSCSMAEYWGHRCHSAECKDVSRRRALGQRIELQGLGLPRPLGGRIGYTPWLFKSACMHCGSRALRVVLLWF